MGVGVGVSVGVGTSAGLGVVLVGIVLFCSFCSCFSCGPCCLIHLGVRIALLAVVAVAVDLSKLSLVAFSPSLYQNPIERFHRGWSSNLGDPC